MFRKQLLKIGMMATGKNIFPAYHRMKKQEFLPLSVNLKTQQQKMRSLLWHSWKYVPYYKKILESAGVVRENDICLENLHHIPILTKTIIRENFDELQSTDMEREKRSPYQNTSGGSTGEPVIFMQDQKFWTEGAAGKWLFFSFITDFPCKHVKLWGSERDILEGGEGFKNQLRNWIYDRTLLNSFRMSKDDLQLFINTINSKRPELIEAYVQSIYELAKFIRNHQREIFSPRGIVTSAGTLYPEIRTFLEETFHCPIFNRYGSREVGDMACNCEKNEGLHLNIFNHHLEILDENLKATAAGQPGVVYVTTLDNLTMPLLRYKIGDIAVPSQNQQCSCGRGMPLIQSILGRDVNLFTTRTGKKIDGEYFTHLFYFQEWVRKFQVVQKTSILIIIKIVGDKNPSEMQKIEKSIRIVMGEECLINWQFCEDIAPSKSGKFLYTVSEV